MGAQRRRCVAQLKGSLDTPSNAGCHHNMTSQRPATTGTAVRLIAEHMFT